MSNMFQIFSKFSSRLIFEVELTVELSGAEASVKLGFAIKAAIKAKINLSGADLRGADLRGADLIGADLRGADLRRANLSEANLIGANLRGANLRGADLRRADLGEANLREANLRWADLSEADLRRADLSEANLRRADLSGVDLSEADLSEADLQSIHDDLIGVLKYAPAEASGFLAALRAGRVDGTCYRGDCACLVGTIANIRGVDVVTLPRRPNSPIERFVLGIQKGDTPETNPIAKFVAEWTEDFLSERAL